MCTMNKGSQKDSQKAELSAKEKLLVGATGLLVPGTIWYIYETAEAINEMKANKPEGYQFPCWTDFQYATYALVIIMTLRVALTKFVFTPFSNWILPIDKWTAEERQDRVTRQATVTFKFMYFLFATTYGYKVLSVQEWWPPILGGSGETRNCWKDYPYQYNPESVNHYYLIQLAYHTHSLIFQILMKHRSDFWEMILHHAMSVILVAFSYMVNYQRVGTLVLYVHDIGDVVGYAIKTSVDTPYTYLTLTLYFLLLITWAFSRLYAFPLYVIPTSTHEGLEEVGHVHGYYFMNGMLYTLFCLHVYWFYLFLIMGYNFLNSGKTVDIQDAPKKKEGAKVE